MSSNASFKDAFPTCPPARYYIGLDLGQARDFTAISILENKPEPVGRDRVTWAYIIRTRRSILHLERLPLGTDYQAVVDHVRQLVQKEPLSKASTLVVDATGVGRPVVDLLRRATLPCQLAPVTITAAGRESHPDSYFHVPKSDLIAGLQLLFQRQEIAISGQLSETRNLIQELGNMRVRISTSGRETYGVWKAGEHDDLVLATALACWRSLRDRPLTLQGNPS